MASRLDADDDLEIASRQESGATVVTARGEVTVFSSPAMRESLRKIAESQPSRVVLDLSGVRYIDSSGVATFVEAMQTIQRHKGKLVLAGLNPRVRGVFEIARLDSVFVMVASVQEALQA
jgi:anti-sigma B factor antagonist